jgi:hypothetical protein
MNYKEAVYLFMALVERDPELRKRLDEKMKAIMSSIERDIKKLN